MGERLLIEVKGHIGNVIQFELTPNEYANHEAELAAPVRSCHSHGPVDGKRHDELKRLFRDVSPGRAVMARYLDDIAWETEVWCAEAPTHLIHFNGERLLGPY